MTSDKQKKEKEGEEAVKIFDLVRAKHLLPTKADELIPLSFIGHAAVSFYKAKIKMMDQLRMTEEQRKATLADGQDAGEMLLDIEARIGELIKQTPRVPTRLPSGKMTGSKKSLPDGITRRRAADSRNIADNPVVVAKIKAEARKNEDIPTKAAVIDAVRREKEEKRKDAATKEKDKKRKFFPLEQQQYIMKLYSIIKDLNRIYNRFPEEIPKNWNEDSFDEVQGLAKIITNRAKSIAKKMEVFKDGQTPKSISV